MKVEIELEREELFVRRDELKHYQIGIEWWQALKKPEGVE